jgi:hypothetical protein
VLPPPPQPANLPAGTIWRERERLDIAASHRCPIPATASLRRLRRIISAAGRAGQDQDPDAATALVLTGFAMPPAVEFNGTVQKNLTTRVIDGHLVYIIPLRDATKSTIEMEKALRD